MRVFLICCFVLVLSRASVAQTQVPQDIVAQALDQNGVVFVWDAEALLRKRVADDFAKDAQRNGFDGTSTLQFAAALASGGVVRQSGGASGSYVADAGWAMGPAKIDGAGSRAVYLTSFLSSQKIGTYLNMFGTVVIDVVPAPPRDYSIVINDQSLRVTERGEYKVLPGTTKVRVTRTDKQPCTWQEAIGAGETKRVSCRL